MGFCEPQVKTCGYPRLAPSGPDRKLLSLAPMPPECEAFRAARQAYGLSPVVIHDNYLINLASSDAFIRERSIAAFRRELERALAWARITLLRTPAAPRELNPQRPSPSVWNRFARRRQD
jgi:hypothetical protein